MTFDYGAIINFKNILAATQKWWCNTILFWKKKIAAKFEIEILRHKKSICYWVEYFADSCVFCGNYVYSVITEGLLQLAYSEVDVFNSLVFVTKRFWRVAKHLSDRFNFSNDLWTVGYVCSYFSGLKLGIIVESVE